MTYSISDSDVNRAINVVVIDAKTVMTTKAYADEFVRLFNLLTDEEVNYHAKCGLVLNGVYTREIIVKGLESKDKVFFLKGNEERFIGVCEVGKSKYKDNYRLSSLVIEPGFRGRGLGKKLMDSVLATYKGKDISLCVSIANPHAYKLYNSLGFKATDIQMVRKAN